MTHVAFTQFKHLPEIYAIVVGVLEYKDVNVPSLLYAANDAANNVNYTTAAEEEV